MTTELGKQAPDFTLPDQNGNEVSLSDFRGKHVVLYFYPKDMTPGCTNEACDFRDAQESFGELDAVIIGVSRILLKVIRSLSISMNCHLHCWRMKNIKWPKITGYGS